MICLRDVSFSYKKHNELSRKIIDDLNLTVNAGEFVAIIGRNGSGKSTLARLINGMLVPSNGTVEVFGKRTDSDDDSVLIHKTVGMVFQNPENQIVYSTVEEDVAFGPENLCLPRDEIRKRVEDSLRLVQMLDYLKADVHALSGGQMQRVAVAGVLASGPKCIIFDEATSMLDPSGRKEILRLAHRLNEDEGITIIWISHLMEEVVDADRAIIMEKGKILLDDSPRELFNRVDDMELLGLGVPQRYEFFSRLNLIYDEEFDLSDIDSCFRRLDEFMGTEN